MVEIRGFFNLISMLTDFIYFQMRISYARSKMSLFVVQHPK